MKKNSTDNNLFTVPNGLQINMKSNGAIGVRLTKRAKSVIAAQAINSGLVDRKLLVEIGIDHDGHMTIVCTTHEDHSLSRSKKF